MCTSLQIPLQIYDTIGMTKLAPEQRPKSYALLGTSDNLGISVCDYIFPSRAMCACGTYASRYV